MSEKWFDVVKERRRALSWRGWLEDFVLGQILLTLALALIFGLTTGLYMLLKSLGVV